MWKGVKSVESRYARQRFKNKTRIANHCEKTTSAHALTARAAFASDRLPRAARFAASSHWFRGRTSRNATSRIDFGVKMPAQENIEIRDVREIGQGTRNAATWGSRTWRGAGNRERCEVSRSVKTEIAFSDERAARLRKNHPQPAAAARGGAFKNVFIQHSLPCRRLHCRLHSSRARQLHTPIAQQ
jgi:hypothetical protein